jgi:hypothetical protein
VVPAAQPNQSSAGHRRRIVRTAFGSLGDLHPYVALAQRLGFDENEVLTVGKAVAGLNAQTKGRKLGLFKPHQEKPKKAREKEQGSRS